MHIHNYTIAGEDERRISRKNRKYEGAISASKIQLVHLLYY